jgi:hypothetical protein
VDGRGELLLKQKKLLPASVAFKRATALDPTNELAQAFQARLEQARLKGGQAHAAGPAAHALAGDAQPASPGGGSPAGRLAALGVDHYNRLAADKKTAGVATDNGLAVEWQAKANTPSPAAVLGEAEGAESYSVQYRLPDGR